MSNTRQDDAFASLMQDEVELPAVKRSALQAAIDYIGNEFEPDDVFTEKQLTDWADRNGFIKE